MLEQQKLGDIGSHKLQVMKRNGATVTGVRDVVSFNSKEIVLETTEGMLEFKGAELHVKRLTLEKGEVDLDGRVDSMIYSDKDALANSAGGFLGRLFK